MLVNNNDARPKTRSPNRGKNWYPGRITVPANLVSRLEIWGARDNGIPPRSTPDSHERYYREAVIGRRSGYVTVA